MNDPVHHPLPNDLVILVIIGSVLIALAVVLPIGHTGALAIAGLTLVHTALAAWTVRTLERLHAEDTPARILRRSFHATDDPR